MSNSKPLVSVTVITYNSSKYVLETLDSIKAQTYKRIELIISDDCSSDNTVELCENWLQENRSRFSNVKMVTSHVNTGIVGNKNRALENCYGEWVKGIAGDDKLLSNCIEDYLNYIHSCKFNITAIHGNIKIYKKSFEEKNLVEIRDYSNDIFNFSETTAQDQYELLLRKNYIGAPSVMIKRQTIQDVGGYNEKFYFEDLPMWLQLTLNNNKIYYLNKSVVCYRLHDSQSKSNKKIFTSLFMKSLIFHKSLTLPKLPKIERFFFWVEYFRKRIFQYLNLDRKTRFNSALNYITNTPIKLIRLYFVIRLTKKIKNKKN